MAIALEKVLETSFEEYCKIKGTSKSDYKTRLLFYSVTLHTPAISDEIPHYLANVKVDPKEKIAESAPDDAEAVVNYRLVPYARKDLEAYGTALIPKKK